MVFVSFALIGQICSLLDSQELDLKLSMRHRLEAHDPTFGYLLSTQSSLALLSIYF